MNDGNVLWLYNNNYYPSETDALLAMVQDNPNVNFSTLLDLAERSITKIYEAEIVE